MNWFNNEFKILNSGEWASETSVLKSHITARGIHAYIGTEQDIDFSSKKRLNYFISTYLKVKLTRSSFIFSTYLSQHIMWEYQQYVFFQCALCIVHWALYLIFFTHFIKINVLFLPIVKILIFPSKIMLLLNYQVEPKTSGMQKSPYSASFFALLD